MNHELSHPQVTLVAAARLEAAARARGASRRYIMASSAVSEAYALSRLRRNTWRNGTLRRTAASVVLAIAIASIVTSEQEKVSGWIASQWIDVATILQPSVEAVRSWNLTKPTSDQPDHIANTTKAANEPQPPTVLGATAADGSGYDAQDHQGASDGSPVAELIPISEPALMPSPIPGAPLDDLIASQPRHPPTLGPVKLIEEGHASRKETASLAADGTQDEQEKAVSNELRAAIDEARSRRSGSPREAPAPRKVTTGGVDVQLRKRATAQPAKVDTVTTKPASHADEAVSETPFSVVSTIPGGLLIRVGSEVKPVRIGERLPDGTRLKQVDESGRNHLFE
ncbi:MAG: hypothetical protein KGZ70_13455 [Hydrogenophaga sp.]|nr:hypothetical protein [Hydrogenophaga sp.]